MNQGRSYVVEFADIFPYGLSPAPGKAGIVVIRAFRRRVTLYEYGFYAHISIQTHRIDLAYDLRKFTAVVVVVRIDNGL